MRFFYAAVCSLLLFVGCSSLPNGVERALYNTRTNEVGVVELVPRDKITESLNSAATVVSAVPGWGTLAGSALGILATVYHGWTRVRNQKMKKALVQGIETAREIIWKLPEGEKIDAKYVEWLEKHQAELGVAKELTKVVANADPAAAMSVANIITAATQPRPMPVNPS